MGQYDEILSSLVSLENKSLNTDTNLLSALPEGRLTRVKKHGKYVWQLVNYENGKRVRKVISDLEMIEALLRKQYLMLRAGRARQRLDVLTEALKVFQNQETDEQILDSLLSGIFTTDDDMLKQHILYPQARGNSSWAKADFEQSSFKPEWKRFQTQAGVPVRSKSEVIIVNLLNYYGIPFHYEEVLYVGDIAYAPDFTIRRADGSILYWEHLGKLNDAKYMERQLNKLRNYYSAGIILGQNLILTFDEGDGVIDTRDIEHIIRTKILM